MARINPLAPNNAAGKTKELYDVVQKKLGRVPNLMQTLGNSPVALEAYLNFSNTLSRGVLEPKVREQIALAVAETNECEYCLSAHCAIGKMVGLEDDEIVRSRQVSSKDPKVDALLKFAQRIVKKRGLVSDEDFFDVSQAGNSNEEITEVIAHVTMNIFTNYFNHVAGTQVDFPTVPALAEQLA